MNDNKKTYWQIEVDTDKCSLCEVCAHKCPCAAIQSVKEDTVLSLSFDPEVCDGCEGEPKCQELCPEVCLQIAELDGPPDDLEARVLISSKLLLCKACGELFAPTTKLAAAARKGVANADRFKDLCPLCRRTNLVVDLTEDKRRSDAEGPAEYRSGKMLLHKARFKSKRKVDPAQMPDNRAPSGKRPPS
jgi:Pyruvate/2-oxoacid:ferredoxin oxidoreductase delta subunit